MPTTTTAARYFSNATFATRCLKARNGIFPSIKSLQRWSKRKVEEKVWAVARSTSTPAFSNPMALPTAPRKRLRKHQKRRKRRTCRRAKAQGKLLLQEVPAQNMGFLHPPTHEHPRWHSVTRGLLCHRLSSDLVKMLLIETHPSPEYFRCAII